MRAECEVRSSRKRRRESEQSPDRHGHSHSGWRHKEQKPWSKERHRHHSHNHHRREEHSKKCESCNYRKQEGRRKHSEVKEQPDKKPRVQITQADSNSESSYRSS